MRKVAKKRMERMMLRKTGKIEKGRGVLVKASLPKKKEKSYEEVLEEVRELEYRRIMLPKRPSVRRSFVEDSLTAQIRTKYKELERIRQEEGRKATTETIIENLREVFQKKGERKKMLGLKPTKEELKRMQKKEKKT